VEEPCDNGEVHNASLEEAYKMKTIDQSLLTIRSIENILAPWLAGKISNIKISLD